MDAKPARQRLKNAPPVDNRTREEKEADMALFHRRAVWGYMPTLLFIVMLAYLVSSDWLSFDITCIILVLNVASAALSYLRGYYPEKMLWIRARPKLDRVHCAAAYQAFRVYMAVAAIRSGLQWGWQVVTRKRGRQKKLA